MKRAGLFLILLTVVLSPWTTVRADGLIVIPSPPGTHSPTPFPLEVKYHRVEVDISDQTAKTFIDQEFYNPTGTRLEGIYIFPLPEGAVLENFSMNINGKMVSAELLDAEKARKIYEDIVRKMRDPALLEYSGRGAFKVRIFPIEPRSTKRVKISYVEFLESDSGMLRYTYPLNTEKFSSKPLNNVSIRVNLESKEKIKTIFCPTHEVEIKRHGNHKAVISFEASNVKPDTDFLLYYSMNKETIGLNLLTHRPVGEDGFFLLTAAPSFGFDKKEIVPKDITFVLDTSGSMAGKKMAQAKRALLFCIENLNARDRFEIVRFSTEAEALFGSLQSASAENLRRAKQFIESLKPIGGTNMEEALRKALEGAERQSGRPGIVVFMTDGKPTIGVTDEDQLIEKIKEANSSKGRIFTFGIGNEVNTHLLDRITEETRAYRIYVGTEEDIELKISNFYEKVKSPVLVDLELDFGREIKVFKTYPGELPNLFKGSQLVVLGRYRGSADTRVVLEGTVEKQEKAFTYRVNFPEREKSNEFIAAMWAAQRIGYLLDQVRLHGEDRELREEIVDLARRYGIVTPYTSYLIIEDEKERRARNELGEEEQTLGAIRDITFNRSMKSEYDSMHRKSGSRSITASKEVAGLKNAQNYQQLYQGRERLTYTDRAGRVRNLTSQVRNIQGRAIYQNGNVWVDSKLQEQKRERVKRIQFASAEYFSLLKREPQSSQFMALGRNVRFVLNNAVYEIFE